MFDVPVDRALGLNITSQEQITQGRIVQGYTINESVSPISGRVIGASLFLSSGTRHFGKEK